MREWSVGGKRIRVTVDYVGNSKEPVYKNHKYASTWSLRARVRLPPGRKFEDVLEDRRTRRGDGPARRCGGALASSSIVGRGTPGGRGHGAGGGGVGTGAAPTGSRAPDDGRSYDASSSASASVGRGRGAGPAGRCGGAQFLLNFYSSYCNLQGGSDVSF